MGGWLVGPPKRQMISKSKLITWIIGGCIESLWMIACQSSSTSPEPSRSSSGWQFQQLLPCDHRHSKKGSGLATGPDRVPFFCFHRNILPEFWSNGRAIRVIFPIRVVIFLMSDQLLQLWCGLGSTRGPPKTKPWIQMFDFPLPQNPLWLLESCQLCSSSTNHQVIPKHPL